MWMKSWYRYRIGSNRVIEGCMLTMLHLLMLVHSYSLTVGLWVTL
jgi:hypothetical protein